MIGLDLQLAEDGDLDLTGGDVTLAADARQAAELEMYKFSDEWFVDRDDGIQREVVWVKNANLALVEAEYRARLEGIGMTVTRLEVDLVADRQAQITWEAIAPEVSSVVIGGRG